MNRASKVILFVSSIVASAAMITYGQITGNLGTTSINYGSALSVQTINTGFGNASANTDSSGGSELDAAYGTITGGNLYLFMAGNYENNGNNLAIFVSGGAAGQSTANFNSLSGMDNFNGSTFSPGFQLTYAYSMDDYAGTLYENEYSYGGPAALNGGYVGAISESSTGIGAGTPSGNGEDYSPAYANLALNNNHGSTMGSSGGAANQSAMLSTTTGLELQIPLSVIGYANGPVEVLAMITGGGDSYLSNQQLPGYGVGTQNPGGNTFNYSSTPNQFFTVVPEPSSIALVVVGLLGAIGLIRRRS